MRPEHQASHWGREVSRAVTPKIGRWVFPARPLAVPLCAALGFLSVFKPSLHCTLPTLRFLQIEGLWQAFVKESHHCYSSNSMILKLRSVR